MRRTSRFLPLFALAALAFAALSPRAATPTRLSPDAQAIGAVTHERGVFTSKGATATLILGADKVANYRLDAELKLAHKVGGPTLQVMPTDPEDLTRRAALYG